MKRLFNVASVLSRGRPPVGSTPTDVVHAENKWRLLRYRRQSPARWTTPVLFVPSLINRHYVLDLLPTKSLAAWLVERGHDVFTIDWGTPGDEDRYLSFDDICDRYLGRAMRRAAQAAGAEKPHVLGYCMGGTLGAIHAAAHPDSMASFVALAAPVRFSEGGLLSAWTRSEQFDVGALVDAYGNVPWQIMQSAFHMLRPTLNLWKTVHLLDRAWDDEYLDGFLALETWGNDNVSFPGECYRRYIEELYRGDAFAQGDFTLSGAPARIDAVSCPLLVVTFEHDTIVPAPSARELFDRASSADKEHLHLAGGHVGAVVSRAASKGLWPKLSDFWAAREHVSSGRGPKTSQGKTTAPANDGGARASRARVVRRSGDHVRS
jgi:poly[(R)-3-hydroxyalkanoate] polymerase subunit PhaC